jgi:hypothetical protein
LGMFLANETSTEFAACMCIFVADPAFHNGFLLIELFLTKSSSKKWFVGGRVLDPPLHSS